MWKKISYPTRYCKVYLVCDHIPVHIPDHRHHPGRSMKSVTVAFKPFKPFNQSTFTLAHSILSGRDGRRRYSSGALCISRLVLDKGAQGTVFFLCLPSSFFALRPRNSSTKKPRQRRSSFFHPHEC